MATKIVGGLRDREGDLALRTEEEKARLKHLNAARDIQLLREQPFDIINNASKLQGLSGDHPMTLTYSKPRVGRRGMPTTLVDYNILSNLSHGVHHWAHPEDRPKTDDGRRLRRKERLVPSYTEKDYNIITTRYLYDHDQKAKKEVSLQKALAAAKYRARNRFNPVLQRFADPEEDARMKERFEAMETERVKRALAQQPPCIKGRATNYWNLVTHEVNNPAALKAMDVAADERKERFKNRYIMEGNWHVRDVSRGHVERSRRMNAISHDRFAELYRRGFDIVTNVDHRISQPSLPYPKPRATAWERIVEAQSGQKSERSETSLPKRWEDKKSSGAQTTAGSSCSVTTKSTRSSRKMEQKYSLEGSTRSSAAAKVSRLCVVGRYEYPFRLEPSCGAVPHPDQLAETMLMATTAMPPLRDEEVRIPKFWVRPWLRSGKISSLQLEAVAYAVRKFRVDAEAEKPSGFCLGDGTGCGKGRVVAALMLHLWNMGYRRLCWITATPDLLQDARRDLQDLGAGRIPLLDFRRVHRYSTSIEAWRPPKGRGRPRKASGERKAKRVKKGKGSAAEEEEGSNRVGCSSPSSSSSSGRGSRTRKGKRSKGHHRRNTVKEEGHSEDGKVEMDAIVVEGEAVKKEEGRGRALPPQSIAVKSRFEQLLEWLRGGQAFICLDECHKAKHVKVPGRKTSSRTGDLILELSRRLPTAPFLYCSATVAADLDNLAYLERLGADFEAFHNVARLGGTSGMEALAAEMKARGIMVARCLSFKGTAFHVDKIPLTDEQVRLYDRCSDLWQDLISLPSGSLTGMTLYANAQRFFKILLISFKLPTAVKWANSALEAGKSVVFSIWTTMESRMTAAAAGVDDGGGDKVDAGLAEKLGPRTLLEYTIRKHLEEKDASLCQFYLTQAAELQLPANPLDELIELMGGSTKVAELTGRTKRQEVDSSGRVRLVPRQTNYSGENINVLEQQAFQRGDKLVAVISEAASAGISLHADARAGSGTKTASDDHAGAALECREDCPAARSSPQDQPALPALLRTSAIGMGMLAHRPPVLAPLLRPTHAAAQKRIARMSARVTSPSTSSAFGAFDYNLSAVRLALRRILLVMIAGPDYTSEDGTWVGLCGRVGLFKSYRLLHSLMREDLPEEVWRSPGPWTSREEFLKIISHVMDDAGLTSSSQARSLDSSAPSETVAAFNLFLNRCLIQPVEVQNALMRWFTYHYNCQYDALRKEDDLLSRGGKDVDGSRPSMEVVNSELLCAGNGPETHLLTLSSDVGTAWGSVFDRYLSSWNSSGPRGSSSSLAAARSAKRGSVTLHATADEGVPEGFYDYDPLPPAKSGLGFVLRASTSGRRPTFILVRPDLPNILLRRPRELLSSRKAPRLRYRGFGEIDEWQKEWEQAYINRRPVCQHMVTGALFSLWALLESLMVDGIPDPKEMARLTRSLKLKSVVASGRPVVGLVLNDPEAAHRAQELAMALRGTTEESSTEPDALEAIFGSDSPSVKVPKVRTPDFDSEEGQDLAVKMAAYMCSLDSNSVVGSAFTTWLDVHAYLSGKNGSGVRMVSNDIDGMVFVRRWLQKLFTRGYVHRGDTGIVFDRLSPSSN
ncbi:hypothetical protein FOZ60_001665 [Perkinsus olseni]|uniref:Helicase ATP-binding domain-containing protein n=1 Tax=Perkinsus olseni TaxID=32597 RepID=A0A7J6NZW9_PEROL|nr:hypothetical protein FOZ60_001665 [Perkinsus olseni]